MDQRRLAALLPHDARAALRRRRASRWPARSGATKRPQVFSRPDLARARSISSSASHPAGCRTTLRRQRHANPGRLRTRRRRCLGEQLGAAVGDALDSSGAWSATDVIWGARHSSASRSRMFSSIFGAPLGVFAGRVRDTTTTAPSSIRPRPNGATIGRRAPVASRGLPHR